MRDKNKVTCYDITNYEIFIFNRRLTGVSVNLIITNSTAQHSTAQHSTLTEPFFRPLVYKYNNIKASINMYMD